MKAMLEAIRSKRMGSAKSEKPEMAEGEEGGEGKDLHAMVSCLSADEKMELQNILAQDKSLAIEKGEPSTEEEGKIAKEIGKEDEANALQAEQDSERFSEDIDDDVAESMVDRTAIRQMDQGLKPRNITERMSMYAAKQQKAKGKL